jgi:putative hemolysin
LGQLVLIGLLILLNAFFAASEIAIISVRKTRLKQLVDEGVAAARLVEKLAEDSSRFLSTIQVGVTLVGFFTAAVAATNLAAPLRALIATLPIPLSAETSHTIAVTLITLLMAFLMLVLGELVPKNLALQHAERISLLVARPIQLLATIASPAVKALTVSTDLVMALFGGGRKSLMPFVTEEEIKTIVDAGEEGGVLEVAEKEMIYSVFELGDTTVREIMVPRIDLFALEANTPLTEAVDAIIKTAHTRIPLYEGNRDNIIGIIHAKDLFPFLRGCNLEANLRSLARPAYFVPESKKLDDLLREFQQNRMHMAIVVDEYGGTAGLVTIEDLLEEIVGEIQDEYDKEEAQIQALGEGEAVFDARTSLDDVNETLGLHLEGEDFDSIGGLVYSQLGKMPAAGDEVQVDSVTVTVLSTVGRRIKKVKVTKHPEHTAEDEAPSRLTSRNGERDGASEETIND